MKPLHRRAFISPRADLRRIQARTWLAAQSPSAPVLVVAATLDAASALIRDAVRAHGACFGWHRATLGTLVGMLASLPVAADGLSPAGGLSLEALAARGVFQLRSDGRLGRYGVIGNRPGLPRAVARTAGELRMGGVEGASLAEGDADLARMVAGFEGELAEGLVADRARMFEAALLVLEAGKHDLCGIPVLLLDVAVGSELERRFVAALLAQAPAAFVTVPAGDTHAVRLVRSQPNVDIHVEAPEPTCSLARLQSHLFESAPAPAPLDDGIRVLSAPGESRECVEIARLILREAEAGVAFDQMAVLLRSPEQYRDHLVEAMGRAGIPAHFARGTFRPDPAGRALLALLDCAAERLSASRFAEYLSLGVVPQPDERGAPPPAPPEAERWQVPEDDVLSASVAAVEDTDQPAVEPAGDDRTLVVPRRWERLLVDAAVIGGRERWVTRLEGLRRGLELERAELDDPDSGRAAAIERSLAELRQLEAFALPLIDALAALPAEAPWESWLEHLSALATRAIRWPRHVLAALAELAPLGPVGPVALSDVRLVLGRRLGDLVASPQGGRAGKVLVASVDQARGASFEVVFVPGLAEKVFPKKVSEDPLALDALRRELQAGLETNDERVAAERLGLRLAVGAARRRLVLSYPRVDADRARPRVASFYGLEVLRAAEGELPGFEELAQRAERSVSARMGWPAPTHPEEAIDDAEYDLALLRRLIELSDDERRGTARYLLRSNEHLARSLRARAMRWEQSGWQSADGFVNPHAAAAAALQRHRLGERTYSPTSLERYAGCPYRFYLGTILRLSPREAPAFIEQLDARQRGSLIHEIQQAALVRLKAERALPLTEARFDEAREILKEVVDEVAERYRLELAPAIDRVWQDGIAELHGDLREWLLRMSEEREWVPEAFELGFGLSRSAEVDPASTEEAVQLDIGVRLRGAIDVVERMGTTLRATDYKTGKAYAREGARIAGGSTLQPLLYALVLEKLRPESEIAGGRLYYCTSRGGFASAEFPLDEAARGAVTEAVAHIDCAIEDCFLPACPDEGACTYCDYRVVCGPHEELKTSRKKRLLPLAELRSRP